MELDPVKYVYTTPRNSSCFVNLKVGVNYILLGKDNPRQWLLINNAMVVINVTDGTVKPVYNDHLMGYFSAF